ncbi:hypothetical protein ABK040_011192 [Willaertia magna]
MASREEIEEQLEQLSNLVSDGIMDEEQYEQSRDKLLQQLAELDINDKTGSNSNDNSNVNSGEIDPYADEYEGVYDEEGNGKNDEVIESYLDTHERLQQNYKNTKSNDNTRWGKSANTVYDETKLNFGSYLDVHDKDSKTRRETKFRSSAQWGKSSDQIYDETKLAFGSYLKTEEEKKKQLEEEERRKKLATIEEIKKKKEGEYLDPRTNKFPIEELQGKFPKGVDATKKELYLSAEDFKKHFGMTLAEYAKLGQFQKKKLKKNLNLF